jgi:hypothetical protein
VRSRSEIRAIDARHQRSRDGNGNIGWCRQRKLGDTQDEPAQTEPGDLACVENVDLDTEWFGAAVSEAN